MPDAVATILRLQRHIVVTSLVKTGRGVKFVRKSALAYSDGCILKICGMHDQCQIPNAVATSGSLQIDGVFPSLVIREFRSVIPNIRELVVANFNRLVKVVCRIDGEIKIHNAVATLDSLKGVRVMTARRQCLTGKHVRKFLAIVAQRDCDCLVISRKYGQMQGEGAVATVDALQEVLISAGSAETLIVPNERQLVRTNGRSLFELVNRMHRQGEVHCAVAAKGGRHNPLIGECIRFCRSDVESVGIIAFALTDLRGQVGGRELMNGQVQDDNAITTIGSYQILGVDSSGVLIESVLGVCGAFANMSHDGVTILGGHREVQGHDAVAAIDSLQIGRISTRLGQRLAIEGIGCRSADGRVDSRGLHGIHRQGEGSEAVTTEHIGAVICKSIGAGYHGCGIKAIVLITFSGADLVLVSHFTCRVDRDDQRHQTVTTVRRGLAEHHGVFTRFIVGRVLTMAGVRRSLTDHIGEGDRFVNRMDGDLNLTSGTLAGRCLVVVADEVAAGGRHILCGIGVGGGQRGLDGVVFIPAERGVRC